MQNTDHWTTKRKVLGVVGSAVFVAVLAVNLFQPQNFRSSPEPLVSPVINYVQVNLYDSDENSVDVSYEAVKASAAVSYDNQAGANDCLYWDGNILEIDSIHARWSGSKVHTQIGINRSNGTVGTIGGCTMTGLTSNANVSTTETGSPAEDLKMR